MFLAVLPAAVFQKWYESLVAGAAQVDYGRRHEHCRQVVGTAAPVFCSGAVHLAAIDRCRQGTEAPKPRSREAHSIAPAV